MPRIAVPLAVFALATYLAAHAAAAPVTFRPREILKAAESVPVPPEWDGVWSTEDSTFECSGALRGLGTGEYTLCSEKDFYTPPSGTQFIYSCTGFADANTVDVTCTGFDQVAEDCELHFIFEFEATRSGNTATVVATTTITYEGAGLGCDFLPDTCTRTKSLATRTAPAPAEYCATPTLPSTWGRVKAQYR
jgi:hypothetical protein